LRLTFQEREQVGVDDGRLRCGLFDPMDAGWGDEVVIIVAASKLS
jgi:hypothetical protein